jgi:hypothetical protein
MAFFIVLCLYLAFYCHAATESVEHVADQISQLLKRDDLQNCAGCSKNLDLIMRMSFFDYNLLSFTNRLVVDITGSYSAQMMAQQKQALLNMIQYFDYGPQATNIGMLTFNSVCQNHDSCSTLVSRVEYLHAAAIEPGYQLCGRAGCHPGQLQRRWLWLHVHLHWLTVRHFVKRRSCK